MNKHAIIALALALAPTAALAAPDFSGTWVRDTPKSNLGGYPIYWMTRVAPGGGGGGGGEPVMQVQQAGGSLQVTDPARGIHTYVLDGSSKTVPTENGLSKATVSARAQDDAVTVTTVQPYGGMPGNVTATFTDTWRLSPDGKVLTITQERVSPAKKQTFKEVYNRR